MWRSVHYDDSTRQFRMWYLGRVPPGNGGATRKMYATSRDGWHWEKPALGLHAINGSTANNVFEAGGASMPVMIDPFEKDPAKRYKLLLASFGYRAAYSAFRRHWTMYATIAV